jgi:Flp pilus assembly protein TadD
VTHNAIHAAELCLAQGRPERAVSLVAPLLASSSEHAPAWLVMARAKLALGDGEQALHAAGMALSLRPDWPAALVVLSDVLERLGKVSEAIDAARQAVALDPYNPYWHNALAGLLLHTTGWPELAEHHARMALSLNPECAAFHVTYGAVLMGMRRRRRARQAMLTALRLEPDNATAHHNLAILDSRGDHPLAVSAPVRAAEGFASALRADPREKLSRIGLDAALRSGYLRTFGIAALLSLLAVRLNYTGEPAAARAVAAAGVLASAGYGTWFVWRLNPALRARLRGMLTAGRQRWFLGVAGVTVPVLVAAVVGPTAWLQALLWTAVATAAIGVLGAIATMPSETQLAEAHGRPAERLAPLRIIGAVCLIGGLVGLAPGLVRGGFWLVGSVICFAIGVVAIVIVRRAEAAADSGSLD